MQVQKIKGLIKGHGYTIERYASERLGVTGRALHSWFKKRSIGSEYISIMISDFNIADPAEIFFDMKVTPKVTTERSVES